MDCIFCKIANKEIPADIVYEDDNIIAFKDIEPKAELHILVVPKAHVESIQTASKELIADLIYRAKYIAKEYKISRSGYKLVFNVLKGGGQLIPHIHLHLLAGENIKLP